MSGSTRAYEEIFNSDKDVYGGWNQYNGAPLESQEGGPENRPFHLTVKLAELREAMHLQAPKDRKRRNKKKSNPLLKATQQVTS
jgi:hypothetical protein